MRVKNYILLGTLLFLLPSFLIWHEEEIPTDFCFDFDAVDYYHIEISDEEVDALLDVEFDGTNKAEYVNAQPKYKTLTSSYPKSILDTAFFENLIANKYQLEKIDPAQFESLSNAICNKPNSNAIYDICSPIYRDILVFKKDNKINGLAKICFTCQQQYVLRPNATLFSIRSHFNFKALKNILLKH